ncbi:LPS O-antigen chain length determinant protein WzzB [Vibrio cholerae]|uniref:LPS O-antigen chain length determinant protein WzzB n=1 Tax=Vibrio cholerae TaxID=666 RepID=UPI001C11FC8C|nr:LPS O-antigen chain length determinant protein WzzB [Vibrio cholerae]
MSSLQNKAPIQSNTYPQHVYPDDEVDARELLQVLYQGKWIIFITTLCISIMAIFYVLVAQEWWTARATVSQPRLHDIADFQKSVKRYQTLFNDYPKDGNIIFSKDLDLLDDPKNIFNLFLQEFNANGNKRLFMQTNSNFLSLQKKLIDESDLDVLSDFQEKWFKRIEAVALDNGNDIYMLRFQSTEKSNSLVLLKEYIDFVNQRVNHQIHSDFLNLVSIKINEIKQQEYNLILQAELKLKMEIERSKYALNIAESAGLEFPIQNFGDKEIFQINIGSRALRAKLDVLKSIEELSIFEPKLHVLRSKLEQYDLNRETAEKNIKINSFYYLDSPEKPLNRDKPKRLLIVVFGFLLGGMFGIAIVLVKFSTRNDKKGFN